MWLEIIKDKILRFTSNIPDQQLPNVDTYPVFQKDDIVITSEAQQGRLYTVTKGVVVNQTWIDRFDGEVGIVVKHITNPDLIKPKSEKKVQAYQVRGRYNFFLFV